MEVIEKPCTQLAIINHGRIVGQGTLEELRNQAQAATGTSLEDVFLKLVDARIEGEGLKWL